MFQILPPAIETSEHYDRHAFDNPRPHAASSATRLSFPDMERMHLTRHSQVRNNHMRWCPAFAANDQQLQHVLRQRAWDYALKTNGRGRSHNLVPENLSLADLKKLVDERFAESMQQRSGNDGSVQQLMHEQHLAAVKRAGGYLALQAAIAYRAWRLGLNSVDIAEAMGIKPPNVRGILARLNKAAKRLGYETFLPHKTTGRKRPEGWSWKRARTVVHRRPLGFSADGRREGTTGWWDATRVAHALALRKASYTWDEVAEAMGRKSGAAVNGSIWYWRKRHRHNSSRKSFAGREPSSKSPCRAYRC